jgi:hypothetical protein
VLDSFWTVSRRLILGNRASDKFDSRKLGEHEKSLGKEEVSGLGGPHFSVLHHRRNPCDHDDDALTDGRHLLRFVDLRAEDVVPLIALECTIYYCCFLAYFLSPIFSETARYVSFPRYPGSSSKERNNPSPK